MYECKLPFNAKQFTNTDLNVKYLSKWGLYKEEQKVYLMKQNEHLISIPKKEFEYYFRKKD